MAQNRKVRIGITSGDINGIGLEVILKALDDRRILEHFIPVVYISAKVMAYHRNLVDLKEFEYQTHRDASNLDSSKVNIINCYEDDIKITLGKISQEGGQAARLSLDAALADIKNGQIDAIVTAPIHKKAMQLAGFEFPGHTEYFAHAFEGREALMLMSSDSMRVALATVHVPINKVAPLITKERILSKLITFNESLQRDFGCQKPRIAVLGLNPHAGDDGLMGSEEKDAITPAIDVAKRKGILAYGPFAADGFFGRNQQDKFDGILAMYHDQGLIPFKAFSNGTGVNCTTGLPMVRTSPDHGTGFDIVGKKIADASSMRRAMYAAKDIFLAREDYDDMHAEKGFYDPITNEADTELDNVDQVVPADQDQNEEYDSE